MTIALLNQLNEKLANMSDKDRRALIMLGAFALAMLLYGVFLLHSKASKAESAALEAQNSLFWLRAQAPRVAQQKPASTTDINTMINDKATSQGISVTVVDNAGRAQVSASHKNASVLGNFFAGLSADGLLIEQLSLTQQQNKSVLAEATVTKAM